MPAKLVAGMRAAAKNRVDDDQLEILGAEVEELSVHTPDLDDVFLALTRRAREEAIAR